MGMVADHQVGAFPYAGTGHRFLHGVMVRVILRAPVALVHDVFAAHFLQFPDIPGNHLRVCPVCRLPAPGESDQVAFHFDCGRLFGPAPLNCVFNGFNRCPVSGLAVIDRMVVGEVDRLHGAFPEDSGVFGRPAETPLLFQVLAFRGVLQHALQVDTGKVVAAEYLLQSGERI